MFGWGYKEDALKWREYQKELDDERREEEKAELLKKATIHANIHLKGGGTVVKAVSSYGRRFYSYGCNFVTYSAKTMVEDEYKSFLKKANTDGLRIENTFYPSAQIKRIERGEVEVTQ